MVGFFAKMRLHCNLKGLIIFWSCNTGEQLPDVGKLLSVMPVYWGPVSFF